MKKIIIGILAVGLIFGSCLFLMLPKVAKNENADEKSVVKIGVTLPLTGDMAFAGIPAQKAINLALNDLKKNDNLKYDYELIFEDDRLDSKQILLNYNRLKSINGIKAILSMWGNATVLTEPANRDEIIHFGCSWGYDLAKGKYNFNHSTFPDEQSDAIIAEMQKRGLKTIGLIYNTTKGDYELMEIFKSKLEKAGISVSFENIFKPDQRDFKTEISKMKAKDADVVFILMISPGMEIFAKQANELGYKPRYTTINYFTYNPELFEGQWYITDALGNQEFMEYFVKETGEKPDSSCVANFYDIIKILVRAYEGGSTEGGAIPDNSVVADEILRMRELQSSTGKVYIDEDGNIHTLPKPAEIKNGKVVIKE